MELIRTQEVLPRRFLVHVCGISAGSRDAFCFIFVASPLAHATLSGSSIKLVYVAPTHTATAQPLDVAYNFPLKASLTRVATAHFSKLLLDAIESDDKGARQVDTRMSSLKPLLPHLVGVALNELSLRDDVREFGWRHLFVPAGEDREAVIAAAQELHEEEKLFRPVGASCGGIPEEQPSDGEDPPTAAADEDGEEEEEEEEERGQRRENREREREREKERERERREHFLFRGSGELIKLPFRSGPRRELNRKFFWPGRYCTVRAVFRGVLSTLCPC